MLMLSKSQMGQHIPSGDLMTSTKKISQNEEWEQENENTQLQKSLEAGEGFARKISSRTTSISKEINKIWHEQM